MADKVLYIGSSLTSAFITRNRRRSDAPPAHRVVSHGGMWVRGANLRADVFRLVDGRIICDRRFAVKRPENIFRVWTDIDSDENGDVSIELSNYKAVIFTAPLLFRSLSLDLWKEGYFLSSAGLRPSQSEKRLIYPISTDVFMNIYRHNFQSVYCFLELVRVLNPDIPVFITPSILPGLSQNRYSASWRRRHFAEMNLVYDDLISSFGVIDIRQPLSTIDTDWATKDEYLADESHHFNDAFVEVLEEDARFGSLTRS